MTPDQITCWVNDALKMGNQKKSAIGVAIIVGYITVKKCRNMIKIRAEKKKIKQKVAGIKEKKSNMTKSLENEGVLVTPARRAILDLGIKELVENLRSGQLSPVIVLKAYQARALEVDKEINAVCDFITEADDWARHLETIAEDDRGPLYGVPISVKECFLLKGYDATIGLSSLIGHPATDDCHLVAALKSLHAIPFCITNFPQTLISYSCSNPIYGETVNPHDQSRTCGGSSGGEAALIAAGGSLLGIGTDLGGSVRIPAHMSGICSLKPTNGRIYESGQRASVGTGCESMANGVYSANGFLSQSVDGLVLSMSALLKNPEKMAREDWRVVPIPWREAMFNRGKKLKIGWYDQDGYFPATPGCSRAVHEAKTLLESNGHEVVQFTPPGLGKLAQLELEFLYAHKGYHALNAFDGIPLDKAIEAVVINYKLPRIIKFLLSPVLKWVSDKLYHFIHCGPELSRDLWVKNAEKDAIEYNLMAAWEEGGYDVLIAPACSIPAPPSNYCSWLLQGTALCCSGSDCDVYFSYQLHLGLQCPQLPSRQGSNKELKSKRRF